MSFQTHNEHHDNNKIGSRVCLVFDRFKILHIVLWSDIYILRRDAVAFLVVKFWWEQASLPFMWMDESGIHERAHFNTYKML